MHSSISAYKRGQYPRSLVYDKGLENLISPGWLSSEAGGENKLFAIAPWVWQFQHQKLFHIWFKCRLKSACFELVEGNSVIVDISTERFDAYLTEEVIQEVVEKDRSLQSLIGRIELVSRKLVDIDLRRPKHPWSIAEPILIELKELSAPDEEDQIAPKWATIRTSISTLTSARNSKQMDPVIACATEDALTLCSGTLRISGHEGDGQNDLISHILCQTVSELPNSLADQFQTAVIISERDALINEKKFPNHRALDQYLEPWVGLGANSITHFETPEIFRCDGIAWDWNTYSLELLNEEMITTQAIEWLERCEGALSQKFNSFECALAALWNFAKKASHTWHALLNYDVEELEKISGTFGENYDPKNELMLLDNSEQNCRRMIQVNASRLNETNSFFQSILRIKSKKDMAAIEAEFKERERSLANLLADTLHAKSIRKRHENALKIAVDRVASTGGSVNGRSVGELLKEIDLHVGNFRAASAYCVGSRIREGAAILKCLKTFREPRNTGLNPFESDPVLFDIFSILNPNLSMPGDCYFAVNGANNLKSRRDGSSFLIVDPASLKGGWPDTELKEFRRAIVVDTARSTTEKSLKTSSGFLHNLETRNLRNGDIDHEAFSKISSKDSAEISFTLGSSAHEIAEGMIRNKSEIEVIKDWVQQNHATLMKRPQSVAIVSPFSGQIKKIRAELGNPSFIDIDLARNVDPTRYDIIWYSCTLTKTGEQDGEIRGAKELLVESLASTIRQAQKRLHLVCDIHLLLMSGNEFFHKMMVSILEKHHTKIPALPGARSIMVQESSKLILSTVGEHDNALKKILEEAESEVIIHSYKCQFPIPFRPDVHEWIKATTERGVSVTLIVGYQTSDDKRQIITDIIEHTPSVKLLMHNDQHMKTLLADQNVKIMGGFNWLATYGDGARRVLIDESELTKYGGNSEDIAQHKRTALERDLEEIDLVKEALKRKEQFFLPRGYVRKPPVPPHLRTQRVVT